MSLWICLLKVCLTLCDLVTLYNCSVEDQSQGLPHTMQTPLNDATSLSLCIATKAMKLFLEANVGTHVTVSMTMKTQALFTEIATANS